jgi:hypothetical protein
MNMYVIFGVKCWLGLDNGGGRHILTIIPDNLSDSHRKNESLIFLIFEQVKKMKTFGDIKKINYRIKVVGIKIG